MTPFYKLEDLIRKYDLIPLNAFYYQMPLYINKKEDFVCALENFKDHYRIFLSWRKPVPMHVLESIFVNKIKSNYDEQTQ